MIGVTRVGRFHFRAALNRRAVDGSEGLMLTLSTLQLGGAVAQLGARLDGIEEVVGSNPIGSTNCPWSSPGTWVTQRTG